MLNRFIRSHTLVLCNVLRSHVVVTYSYSRVTGYVSRVLSGPLRVYVRNTTGTSILTKRVYQYRCWGAPNNVCIKLFMYNHVQPYHWPLYFINYIFPWLFGCNWLQHSRRKGSFAPFAKQHILTHIVQTFYFQDATHDQTLSTRLITRTPCIHKF